MKIRMKYNNGRSPRQRVTNIAGHSGTYPDVSGRDGGFYGA
jgi:hypothetical protein